jgi:hypothetical protein
VPARRTSPTYWPRPRKNLSSSLRRTETPIPCFAIAAGSHSSKVKGQQCDAIISHMATLDRRKAKAGIARSIVLYNALRPHHALGQHKPSAVWRDAILGPSRRKSIVHMPGGSLPTGGLMRGWSISKSCTLQVHCVRSVFPGCGPLAPNNPLTERI